MKKNFLLSCLALIIVFVTVYAQAENKSDSIKSILLKKDDGTISLAYVASPEKAKTGILFVTTILELAMRQKNPWKN